MVSARCPRGGAARLRSKITCVPLPWRCRRPTPTPLFEAASVFDPAKSRRPWLSTCCPPGGSAPLARQTRRPRKRTRDGVRPVRANGTCRWSRDPGDERHVSAWTRSGRPAAQQKRRRMPARASFIHLRALSSCGTKAWRAERRQSRGCGASYGAFRWMVEYWCRIPVGTPYSKLWNEPGKIRELAGSGCGRVATRR